MPSICDRWPRYPRGGGAFLGEIDTNLTLWKDDELLTLYYNKLRGPAFDPFTFRLEFEDAGLTDEEGNSIRPPVAVPLTDAEESALSRRRNEDENRLLNSMVRFPSSSIADWAKDCGWQSVDGVPNKAKVHRVIEQLAGDKLARKYRGRWVLTEAGKTEAQRV